jgi:hypothetical protein
MTLKFSCLEAVHLFLLSLVPFDLFYCSNNAPLPTMQNLVMQHVDHSAGDFIDLLKRLLAYEPSARLTAEEALSHGFFHKTWQ